MAGGVAPPQGPAGVTAGLGVWYQADQEVTSAGDGQPVTVWGDSGAGSWNLTAVSAPTLKTNELNGQPVVRFDGVDDEMWTASMLGSILSAAQAQSVFVVQKQVSPVGNSVTYSWDSSGGAASNELSAHLAIGPDVYHIDGSAVSLGYTRAVASQPWTDTWHIVEMIRDGTTNSSIAVEGNPLTITTQNPGSFNTAGSAVFRMSGRAYIATPSYHFYGDIAELIIYNRVLTTLERDSIRNYLKQKWGIAQDKVILDAANSGYVLINSTTNDRLAVS
jgi:hypothetical protein